jgi:hypothetical protein
MKRFVCLLGVAALCSVASLTAQGTPDPQKPTAEGQKPQTITVTGCITPGAGTGQFMLTNAMPSTGAADKDKPTTPTAAPAAGKGTSYMLMGGGDLKPHVGHKVEIVGSVDKKMAAPPTTPPAGKEPMSAGTLNVTSLKMVSTTCP